MLMRFFAAILAAGLLASPAHAEWRKGESEHFIVYGDTSERGMRTFVQKLERFDQVMRLYLPLQSDYIAPKLPVYLARNTNDMRAVWPDIPPTVGGFYARSPERIFAVVGSDGEGDTVLLHEYAHHYMYQGFTAPYPAWFIEGFAEYYATADVDSDRVRIGRHSPGRMNSLTQGANSWAPMEALLRNTRTGRGRIEGHAFYAQAWALTHYLMSTPERKAMLGEYLRAVAGGADPVEAVQPAFGRTPNQLQSDVQSYLLGPISNFTPQHQFTEADVTVTLLTPAEQDSLWLDLRLARFVPEDQREGNLAEALALAAKWPGEPLPGRVLAQAYLDLKRPAEAVATMAPLAASHPEDAPTLRLLAVSLMDQGDAAEDGNVRAALYGQARTHLARAYQKDASDFRIYTDLARNRSIAPGYPNDNDLETLLIAAELAPQLSGVRMQAARALLRRDMPQEAIAMLRPIAADPHGSGLKAVRELLAEAYAAAGQVAGSDAAPQEGDEDTGAEEDAGTPD